MKSSFLFVASLLKRLRRDERGVTATIVALSMTALLGVGIAGVDIGRIYVVQRQLQISADDAALAGAAYLQAGSYVGTPSCASSSDPSPVAEQCASHFSARQGGQNDFTGLVVSVTPKVKCLSSVTVPPCSDAAGTYNSLEVIESANVPLLMGQLLGYKDGAVPVSVTAAASAKGGTGKPLDIMVVIDATASMQSGTDSSCVSGQVINGVTYSGTISTEKCALLATQALLQGLDPHYDNVGLLAFPGVTSSYFSTVTTATGVTVSGIPRATTCGETLGTTAGGASVNDGINSYYGPLPSSYPTTVAPFYTVVNFENGYKGALSSTVTIGTDIDASDPLSIAVGDCSAGVDTTSGGLRGYGGASTYYAGVIAEAANDLTLVDDGNQKVMIILTDGEAQASSSDFISDASTLDVDQCQQAIAAAQAASAAGIWVYTVGYGSESSGCTSDTSNLGTSSILIDGTEYPETVNLSGLSPCTAIEDMATSSQYFFSGTTGCSEPGEGGSSTSIVELFEELAQQLTPQRLIPTNEQ